MAFSRLNWFYKMKRTKSRYILGQIIDQIVSHMPSFNSQPIVVVMQLIKAHKFQDLYSVLHSWNVSKFWISPNFPQSDELRKWFNIKKIPASILNFYVFNLTVLHFVKFRLLYVRDSFFERLTQTIYQQSFCL
uniref:Uncharacterized protein LOC104242523 n=1 Tax=Nicotiana sylvestris TaxID=4096 RepID=A0A1U7YAS6_NICSY|nr:PREDICTED: uncharacterized protein LOC104242523 [Nicotiana sylvestris]